MTVPVRVEESIRNRIKIIAKEEGKTISEIITEAVERYEREKILESFNAAYAKLRKNPEKWKDIQREREELESFLLDGLEEEPN